MSLDDEWGRTVEPTAEYARPEKLEGHLIIVFPLGYIEHMQTKFTVPGKKSDAICCDIIDLDDVDESGQPGKVYRTSNLMQAQLIVGLRPFIGRKTIVRIGKGAAKNGMNPPWTAVDAVPEPGAVERADAWMAAHPSFNKSPFTPRTEVAPPVQPVWNQPAQQGFQAQPQQYQPAPQVPSQQYAQAPYGQQAPVQQFQPAPQQQYAQAPQQGFQAQPQQFQQGPPQQGYSQHPPAAGVPGSANLDPQELSLLAQARQQYQERERQHQAQFPDQPPF